MPFRSEKQRRFLWAKHPDIAKEWAHKYPDSNKGLPMYAHDKEDDSKPVSKEAALTALQAAIGNKLNLTVKSIFASACDKNTKKANSKLEHIKLPQDTEPTYAGERKLESILKPETEDEGNIGETRNVNNSEKNENMQSNPLLSKLAVVLAPKIQQDLENIRAQQEARNANRTPQNVNIKKYPVQNFNVPPPMGMTAPPQAPQAPQQSQAQPNGQMAPVGGGASPNANPINSFGGLSSTGDINGNASLGTQNQMGGEKLAYGVWDEYGVAERTPYYNFKPNDKLPTYLERASELAKQKGYRLGFTNERYGESIPGKEYAAKLRQGKLPVDYHDEQFPAFFDMYPMDTRSFWQKLIGKKYQDPAQTIDDLHGHNIEDDKEWKKHVDENWPVYRAYKEIYETPQKAAAQKCSCGCGDTTLTCKCPDSCSCRQKGGSCYGLKKQAGGNNEALAAIMCISGEPIIDPDELDELEEDMFSKKAGAIGLWDRIRAKKKRGEKPAKPGDKDYPDAKSWDKVTGISEKKSSTPAWQRSAGKNEEGGLNEKGRKSYEREHGGNLQAPVTEKNPTGKAEKRQNSFCSRMCGMKRVNTGADTAKDPDSRINKSLRKWNCKCGSAFEFGAFVCGFMDKQAMPRGLQGIPSGSGPDQIEDAILRYNQLRALVRPDDATLKQYGLKRDAFQQALRGITTHSQDKDRFELRKVAPNPGLHAAVAGLSSLALPAAAGYFGGPQAALATLPISGAAAGAAYVNASMKREGVKRTAKLLKQYGLLNPQLLRQAYPLLGDSYRIA